MFHTRIRPAVTARLRAELERRAGVRLQEDPDRTCAIHVQDGWSVRTVIRRVSDVEAGVPQGPSRAVVGRELYTVPCDLEPAAEARELEVA